MPNPKRRHSKARGRKRRTHWKLDRVEVVECPQCHAPKLPHKICQACGYYNGRLVVDFAAQKAKKEQKRKKKQGPGAGA